jgi:hypothetical protein
MASAVLSYKRRKDVCSEPSVMVGEPRSLNDLPNEILLKILSHFGPDELCLIIAKVCEKWNSLAKMWYSGRHFLTNVIVLLMSAELPR